MIVHIDTSSLIDALTGRRRALPTLVALVEAGHRVELSSIVLYEWLRGPRTRSELRAQEEIFPRDAAVAFDAEAAATAAALNGGVRRARGREIDLAVAACAMTRQAALWTLNPRDFDDIPELALV